MDRRKNQKQQVHLYDKLLVIMKYKPNKLDFGLIQCKYIRLLSHRNLIMTTVMDFINYFPMNPKSRAKTSIKQIKIMLWWEQINYLKRVQRKFLN